MFVPNWFNLFPKIYPDCVKLYKNVHINCYIPCYLDEFVSINLKCLLRLYLPQSHNSLSYSNEHQLLSQTNANSSKLCALNAVLQVQELDLKKRDRWYFSGVTLQNRFLGCERTMATRAEFHFNQVRAFSVMHRTVLCGSEQHYNRQPTGN